MAAKVTLVATLTDPPSGEDLAALSREADWLEVRADLVGDLDPDWLRSHFSGGLLYTLRSRQEGGDFEGSAGRRERRLAAASRAYDLVDLEEARDARAELLREIPAAKRLVSWHGSATDLEGLRRHLSRLSGIEARLYKLVPAASQPGEELAPLALLRSTGRDDVLAFAAGEIGAWTRLVSPYLGAAVVFGAAGPRPGAPGQPSVAALRRDYGLPELPLAERLFGVVGNPVSGSLSPRLHNGMYRLLGIPAIYLAFHVEAFGDFWLEVVESGSLDILGLPLEGISVTTPHKEIALAVAGAASPLAQRIGAANTLISTGGVWEAEITDPDGVVLPLQERGIELADRRAAVVGAGPAGRAAAAGLAAAGAKAVLVNRGRQRGTEAAKGLGIPFVPLSEFDPGDFDVVVHATPLGRGEGEGPPFDPGRLRPGSALVDLAYLPEGPTALVQEAGERGCRTVDGREVLLSQAREQFRLMTGQDMPRAPGRELLGLPGGVEDVDPG